MRWLRTAAAVAGAAALSCGAAVGNASAADAAHHPKPPGPSLYIGTDTDARPGGVVQIDLQNVPADSADILATSPAFHAPARLTAYGDSPSLSGFAAVAMLSMTDKPGRYPVTATIRGHVVGRDHVQVVGSRRPSFDVSPTTPDGSRPGEQVSLHYDDLFPGEQGTSFSVTSDALRAPVRLAHSRELDFFNPRAFSAGPDLKPDLKDGTYAFTLNGPHGRITSKTLTVRGARPGDPDYLGKAHGPAFFKPSQGPYDARERDVAVVAGARVNVLWRDEFPDPGEYDHMVATSPAFAAPDKLKRDDSKGADGDFPRFYGVALIRPDLKPGRYQVTVTSHHGRLKRISTLTVTAAAKHHNRPMDAAPSAAWTVAGAGAIVAAGGVAGGMLWWKRRPN